MLIALAGLLNTLALPGYPHAAIIPDALERISMTCKGGRPCPPQTEYDMRTEAEDAPHAGATTEGRRYSQMGIDQSNKPSPATSSHDEALRARVSEIYGKLPLRFEANRGQADASVKFIARGSGYSLFLKPTEALLALTGQAQQPAAHPREQLKNEGAASRQLLRMKLVGANRAAQLAGIDEMAGKSNYLTGHAPKTWRAGIANYAKVRQQNVYPGIDLVYYGNQQQLEYDFIVAPGAAPAAITLDFDGARAMRIDANGDLVLDTSLGEVRQHQPVIYQEVSGIRKQLAGRYQIKGKHRVGFQVGDYDRRLPLVIDPVLSYATYFGSIFTVGQAITVDRDGNVYVAGWADAADLPTTRRAFQKRKKSTDDLGEDAFVMKLNPAGTALVYATYLGGSEDDEANAIAIDAEGNAYVTGYTESKNFPTTPGAFQTAKHGFEDIFVAKLNATGTDLIYSTYLGGDKGSDVFRSMSETGNDIAVDAAGHAYVVGVTSWNDFPVTPKAFQTRRGSWDGPALADAFVTKFNADGTNLVYSTYLGGFYDDEATGIALDAEGNAYVTGWTESGRLFPTTAQALKGKDDDFEEIFITKLNPQGRQLVYSSRFGGSDTDKPYGIAVDASGNAYVTGETLSQDFPTVNPMQAAIGGGAGLVSQDDGATWSSLVAAHQFESLNNSIGILAVDPQTLSTLYAATDRFDQAVFKSTNSGATWQRSKVFNSPIMAMVIDPQTPATIYVGVSNYGGTGGRIAKSTDGGTSWNDTFTTTGVLSLAIDPRASSTVYAGTVQGVFKSTDNGGTWGSLNNGLDGLSVFVLAVDTQTTATLYAGTKRGLFKSTDGGATWEATSVTASVVALTLDPQTPSTIYAAAPFKELDATGGDGRGNPRRRISSTDAEEPQGLLKSTDGGATWHRIDEGLGWSYLHYSLTIDPQHPATLYVSTYGGLFKSRDGGDHFTATTLQGTDVKTVAIAPTTPATIYTGASATTDAFVAVLNATGTALIYSTYFGGLNDDSGRRIAVDATGNAYIIGNTKSFNLPITANALQSIYGDSDSENFWGDSFIAKFNPNGTLAYSTYLGGDSEDDGFAIAVDARGDVYVTGETDSLNYPLVNPLQPDLIEDCAFIAKLRLSTDSLPKPPAIISAGVVGKKLIITGEGFSDGAVIMIDGVEQATSNDAQSPTAKLIGKKAGKKLEPGLPVTLRVKNADGEMSAVYSFVRPAN
jgi:photosystem II stability/assembly factor-like uncharacterized protein